MKFMALKLSVLFCIAVLNSCGRLTSESVLSSEEPSKIGLIIAAAGWFTCDNKSPEFTDVFQATKKLIDDLPTNEKPQVVSSCFTFNQHLHFSRNDGEDTESFDSPAEFLPELQLLAESVDGKVALIGHSHGAWLLMQFLLNYSQNLDIYSLNTIDPISYEKCHPIKFLGNPACRRSPDDINESDRRMIAEMTPYWQNDYQTRSLLIHSEAIKEADVNIHHPQSEFYRLSSGAHSDMDGKTVIWNSIQERVSPGI